MYLELKLQEAQRHPLWDKFEEWWVVKGRIAITLEEKLNYWDCFLTAAHHAATATIKEMLK